MRDVFLTGKHVVQMDPDRNHGPSVRISLINGDQNRYGVYKVWRLLPEDCPFTERFGNQVHLEIGKIPEAAVDQPRGFGSNARCEIAFFKEQARQAPQCSIAHNACAGYAAADDDNVEQKIVVRESVQAHEASHLWML